MIEDLKLHKKYINRIIKTDSNDLFACSSFDNTITYFKYLSHSFLNYHKLVLIHNLIFLYSKSSTLTVYLNLCASMRRKTRTFWI